MFNPNIDLGQIIIATLISVIGYFVKRTIDELSLRLDKHEERLFDMAQDVQRLVGFSGVERRQRQHRNSDE